MQNTTQRIIKFRAKRTDDGGRWAYGYFVKTPITTEFDCDGQFLDSGSKGRYCIIQDGVAHEIDIKTLGEFTGLKDKNGNEIYESDIIKIFYKDEEDRVAINSIEYNEKTACFEFSKSVREFRTIGGHNLQIFADNGNFYFEVIGNVWENPELLK